MRLAQRRGMGYNKGDEGLSVQSAESGKGRCMELHELKLLTVEDEPQVRGMICDILREAGFRATAAAGSCAEARALFRQECPDCVLLDVMLPDGDGFELMRELRTVRDVPTLFLSARDADEDRLLGLGLGADDYIVKPFLPAELVLRVGAVLKRTYHAQLAKQEPDRLRLGDTEIDWESNTIRSPRGVQSLTAKERALLHCLAERRGKIVTVDELCRAGWGEDFFGYENTLMVHLRRLRAKIEPDPSHPRWLLTQRGLGYRLAEDDAL